MTRLGFSSALEAPFVNPHNISRVISDQKKGNSVSMNMSNIHGTGTALLRQFSNMMDERVDSSSPCSSHMQAIIVGESPWIIRPSSPNIGLA